MEKLGYISKTQAIQSPLRSYIIRYRSVFIMAGIGFLLGRATILGDLSPFALALFAAIYFLKPNLRQVTAGALIMGSVFAIEINTWSMIMQIMILWLIFQALEKYERIHAVHSPQWVFTTAFLVLFFVNIIDSELSWFTFMITAVEAVLSSILTMIFFQALPLLLLPRQYSKIRNEEMICLVILVATLFTGMAYWQIWTLSIDQVLSKYLILLVAMLGGVAYGSSVGVMTGLILSLANVAAIHQISILAFSGLLAGLLKHGGKIAVGFGMMLASTILALYVENQVNVVQSMIESLFAFILFMLTPKKMIAALARWVPGTQEYTHSQYDYHRHIRDMTADRVHQFSNIFKQLSYSFRPLMGKNSHLDDQEASGPMGVVMNKICAQCYRRQTCWEREENKTIELFTDMIAHIESNPAINKNDIVPEWKWHCHKTDRVLTLLKQQHEWNRYHRHWQIQIQESRKLVSEQLHGVSQVMDDLVREICREAQDRYAQEEQIMKGLEELGVYIQRMEIISLTAGNIKIELIHTYPPGFADFENLIVPLLTDILKEKMSIEREQAALPEEGMTTTRFASAKEIEVETGVAYAAKMGEYVSGDSFAAVELDNGKFAVALSDGMGNGERAKAESSAALSILQQLLQSGMEEKAAIKSVNSILMLRSPDEVYATVDLVMIDLLSAQSTFMKIGATPSFIKRGRQVFPISANNLPIGILHEIEIEMIKMQLQPEDILVMMSDGVFDAPGYEADKELWIESVLADMLADTPQDIADALLHRVIRQYGGEIADDMTVIAVKISKVQKDWASLSWHEQHRAEWPQFIH